MTKAELKLLEKAFAQEISGALSDAPGLLQTKSKLAAKLVDEGYLERATERVAVPPFGHMTCEGYRLTLLGNATYCMTC